MANESKIGLVPQADLTTGTPTNKQMVARIRALIPDPDTRSSSGAISGKGFYDEMSPAIAAQLHVELTALETAITNA